LDVKERALTSDGDWQRRYDIDWLRILAMGMLIIYHGAISFQPWANIIFFMQNEDSLQGVWVLMEMFNIWRIPILFMVSGMGLRFAIERRSWQELLKDRAIRILLPLAFGFFCICPISSFLWMKFYGREAIYFPNPGHLWFLAKIFLYVLLLLPLLAYLKNHPDNWILGALGRVLRRPWMLGISALLLMLEAWVLDPEFYSFYVLTPHGFWLGMVCFATGFVFISLKGVFWQAVVGIRWATLSAAVLLLVMRLVVLSEAVPNMLIAVESMAWMLAILGFGAVHLNNPSDRLAYLSEAVYPLYIIHMPVQFGISLYLLPLAMPAFLKLVLLIAGTFGISALMYEYAIKKLKWIRPLFGLKLNRF